MNKLIKPFFGILFILLIAAKSFGQQYYPVQPPRLRAAQQRRFQQQQQQRRFQGPPQGFQGQPHLNPYVRPYNPGNRVVAAPAPARKVQAVKEAFIGQQMNLSQQQSHAFWPLYRQYVQDMTAVRILMRENSTRAPNGTVQIDNQLAYESELVNIRKHYRDEFLRVLPPEKVSQLYKSEREFNDEMLRQLSERSIRAGN